MPNVEFDQAISYTTICSSFKLIHYFLSYHVHRHTQTDMSTRAAVYIQLLQVHHHIIGHSAVPLYYIGH